MAAFDFSARISKENKGYSRGRRHQARRSLNPNASFRLNAKRTLSADDDVITFVARNIEPLRGYHVFMRALPRIMRELPHAEIVVMGSEHSYYGGPPPVGSTWKSIFLREVENQIDPRRVHFTGRLPHDAYLSALQVSSAHVYLTYPFVLSWSFIKSLSVGCMVVGSDTAPVREVIDGQNGILVPFFNSDRIAENIRRCRSGIRESSIRCVRLRDRQRSSGLTWKRYACRP